jgi:purine-binding chemotaxis protein CheW
VLPIVGLRALIGFPEAPLDEAMRVIVIEGSAPVGFVVDRVENLVALAADRIEDDDAGAGSIDPGLLDGVIKGAEGKSTIKILNPRRLLRGHFSQLSAAGRRPAVGTSVLLAATTPAVTASERTVSLVSFELGKQEYALPLARVREIIQLPDRVSEVPRPETAVLGVVTLRGHLLPLVSLRALLGLPIESAREESGKVLVLTMGGGTVGVEITSICRLDHGKRLVALLSPDHLFRSDLVRRVLSEQGGESIASPDQTDENAMADEQFIIFQLGDQEYGLPIAAVDEIARPPEQIARLPKAPAFIDGVMNLRGAVVPIVDLRRRFEITSKDPVSSQRILVLALGSGKTGFMVDSVSEVMRVPASAIRPAPEVSPEQMRLIGRVVNLDAQDRMILLVDPAQLLDRLEADVLAKFDRINAPQASKIS